jgi:hypothetical protein
MSLIQAARRYAELKNAGLTVQQISKKTGVEEAAIRERLELLSLSAEEQEKLDENKLSYVQALKLCERRRRTAAKSELHTEALPHAYEPE